LAEVAAENAKYTY